MGCRGEDDITMPISNLNFKFKPNEFKLMFIGLNGISDGPLGQTPSCGPVVDLESKSGS